MNAMHAERRQTGIDVRGACPDAFGTILTTDALRFIAALHRTFGARREALLNHRVDRQRAIDSGEMPEFPPVTKPIRDASWTVAAAPADLTDRRVEITGPTERKMIINALNSGAKVFMADFEDSNAPTWANMVEGQINLRDAVRRTISYVSPEGRQYRLAERTATLVTRPRGWHLAERHVCVDGKPVSGSLFDFGLYFFHNARALVERGSGPYFYLPKLESHEEARLWNDVFQMAQDTLGIPRGTIRATVLIETILAAFETEEILYELREHSSGLNCGRWDYIFSFIKKFRNHPDFLLPDRAQVTMTAPFMRAYTQHVVKVCHKRGAHAIGGMAAQIPIKNDAIANEAALSCVCADKEREVNDGHDGTWVAHPGLVPVAMEIFNAKMAGANQIARQRDDVNVSAADLLAVPRGTITEEGLRTNIRVGIQYLEAWLSGNGCVPLYNLMEDAATAEISRTQIWQWIRHGGAMDPGKTALTAPLFRETAEQEMVRIAREVGNARFKSGRFADAAGLFDRVSTDKTLVEFLTLPAYELLW